MGSNSDSNDAVNSSATVTDSLRPAPTLTTSVEPEQPDDGDDAATATTQVRPSATFATDADRSTPSAAVDATTTTTPASPVSATRAAWPTAIYPPPTPYWASTATAEAMARCQSDVAIALLERFINAFNANDVATLEALLPDASASDAPSFLDQQDDPTLLYEFSIYGNAAPEVSTSSPEEVLLWLQARVAAGERWQLVGMSPASASRQELLPVPTYEGLVGLILSADGQERWTQVIVAQVNCEAGLLLSWRAFLDPLPPDWEWTPTSGT